MTPQERDAHDRWSTQFKNDMHDKQVKMDNDMAQMSYNLNHMFDNNPFFNK